MKKRSYGKLFGFVLLCVMVGSASGLFTDTGSWYQNLNKPWFQPPDWLFGPVWTVLYILMGISIYLAVEHKAGKLAYNVFGVQLFLNFLWSLIFFRLHLLFAAFIEILLLWTAIMLTMVLFYRKSNVAAALLVPYLAWVSFAAMLNFSIYFLNQ